MKLEEIFFDEETFLYEMANLGKDETGLDKTVYASPKQHSAGPRIKVNYDNSLVFDKNKNFSVSISNNPRVVAGDTEENVIKKIGQNSLDNIYDWVLLNQEILLKFWNNELLTKQFLDGIKAI